MQKEHAQHRRKMLISFCDRATVNTLVRVRVRDKLTVRVSVRDELRVIVRVRDEVRVRPL